MRRHPRRYLATVVASGAAIGAAAILPGIGTLAALAAVSGETLLFLEATTVFVLATAEVHGITAADREHRREHRSGDGREHRHPPRNRFGVRGLTRAEGGTDQ